MTEETTAQHTTQAVVILNDVADYAPGLVEALTAPMADADGARFTRVCGDGPDNGWPYAGLDGSTVATVTSVFVLAAKCKSTDVAAFLASLPWGVGSAVAYTYGTDKAKPNVNIIGRWGAPT